MIKKLPASAARLPFKPHILGCRPLIGGKTRDEVRLAGTRTVYKLSSNENPLGPSPGAIRAIRANFAGLNEYGPSDDTLLRKALASSFDKTLLPENFLCANSAMEVLDLICRAFLEPGSECIVSTPAFPAYGGFARMAGAEVIDVPLQDRHFDLDVEGILDAVGSTTRIVFIASPNNPTGSLVTTLEMDRLLDGLPPHVIVVYDEVYHHYVQHPAYARAEDYVLKGYPLIGIHSFSKAYGLAGMRLGYAFSTPEITGYLGHLRRPFLINTLSMAAGIGALKDPAFLAKTVQLASSEKSWFYDRFDELGIPYWPSHANFILFQPPYQAERFVKDLLQAGIMVRDASPFGAPGCIRVSMGTHEATRTFFQALQSLVISK